MNLKASQVLVLILLATFAIALWKDDLRAEVTYCTFCCNPGCDGANGNATPAPTPTASPSPGPSPTPTPDAIVAPSGGDFTTIAAAYSAASCGDLIWVRDGTYNTTSVINLNKTCTEGNEITIQNYPAESPHVVCTDPTNGNDRVEMNGQYNIWDGIEVSGCWDGIKIYNSYNKVLNSKIHNNMYTGIQVVPLSATIGGIELAGNTIEVNGYTDTETCTVGVATSCTGYEGLSQKNVQQIYLSNTTCNNIDGVHAHVNTIRNFGGRAFQMNGSEGGDGDPCQPDGIKNVVFENNNVSGGSWGIAMYYGIADVQILSNTFVMDSWPTTNDSDHTIFGVWGVDGLELKGNDVSSSDSAMRPYHFYDTSIACPTDDLNENTWDLAANDWIWNGGGRSDFSSAFTSITGCGANDTIN